MVTTLLIVHVLYGGLIHLFVTKTIEAITDFANLYNFLNGGIVYHQDLEIAKKNAIAWSIATLFYFAGMFTLIYITLQIV